MPQLSHAMNAEQGADYVKALTACESLADLRALVMAYRPLALDAVPQVEAMTEADWPAFVKGLKSERRGRFAGEDWMYRFGAILVPYPMLRVSQVAAQYKVPFGVAWARLRDVRPDLLELPSGESGGGSRAKAEE